MAVPEIPAGVITGIKWHADSRHLAVTLASVQIPGDVFVVDMLDATLTRWTFSETGVDTRGFAAPEMIEWTSFDDRPITGFLYRPPARFSKRPL